MSFYDKEEYNSEDILSLIENEIEESIHLDFKEADALGKSDSKRKEISKDVSAFANSDGGIIIYGIKEENHKAKSLSFVDGNIFTKEWIEQIINSSIQRHIPDLLIIPVRFHQKIENSVYIIKIPKSIEAPHICKDKRFYKRFNFESVAMEEYEIRQLYDRKVKSSLILAGHNISKVESDDENIIKLLFEVSIINNGDILESSYKTNVYFNYPTATRLLRYSWDRFDYSYNFTRINETRVLVSSVSKVTIYPEEKVTVMRFFIEFEKALLRKALDSVSFDIVLCYSNGEHKIESSFDEVIKELEEIHLEKNK
jgi:hypothetical protein